MSAQRIATRITALGRRWLWRAVLAATGGLTVTGALPRGGCVVVANHSSHADTAALLAALDARHATRVAAAADYWFAAGPRATVCRVLGAAFPVRRSGGGGADLAAAAQLLRAGHAVVVFPEGTRGSGRPGPFHSGAFRLAADAGVPVVPVGIVGTGRLLPKNGGLHRSPVAVRIGAARPVAAGSQAGPGERDPAVAGAVTEDARDEVTRLTVEPAPLTASRWRERLARVALSWRGVALVAAWAVAEAVVWPLVPELVVFALVVAAPRAGLWLVPVAVLASLAGGLLTLTLAGSAPAAPLVTDRMRDAVRVQVAAEGAAAMAHQSPSGIPFTVYAAEAGRSGVAPAAFLGAALIHRGLRIALIGGGCSLIGLLVGRARHLYPVVVLGGAALFATGLALVVASWA